MMMKTVLVSAIVLACVSSSLAYSYVGCFKDKPNRILEGKFSNGPNMTVQYCVQICEQEGDYFAGVEYGGQCICGKTLQQYDQLSNSECSTPCTGDSSQKCGATWKISVYTTSFSHDYLGCYVDKPSRILEGKMITNDAMTNDMCIKACQKTGKRFALTEYAKQCICGNHLKTYAKKDDTECDYKCKGDNSQMCGGFWRGSLYLLNY